MDAFTYVGKFVRETSINVGVEMRSPTVLNLANYGRALVSDNLSAPCVTICNNYFVEQDFYGIVHATVMLIRCFVPAFHHHILDAHVRHILGCDVIDLQKRSSCR